MILFVMSLNGIDDKNYYKLKETLKYKSIMSNFINDKLIERIKNIQDQVCKVEHLDMNNLVDLKKAKETVRVIKEDFEAMVKESPIYTNMVNLVAKFMNYDVRAELNRLSEYIDNKIEELKRKEDFKHAHTEREETDKSIGEDNPVENWENVEDEDDDLEDILLRDFPLSGEELIDDFIDEGAIEEANLTKSQLNTYANLIAEHLNTNWDMLDRVDNEDQIEYLSNVLFEFVIFTMNR